MRGPTGVRSALLKPEGQLMGQQAGQLTGQGASKVWVIEYRTDLPGAFLRARVSAFFPMTATTQH